MNIHEKRKGIYVKAPNEIEQYLINIIQRYFETDEKRIIGSRENIIQESIRRIKNEISLTPSEYYVTSVNGKTGAVQVTPEDFGAEPKIQRNTAFNKDFGDVEGTVCEGNDPRLSNAREPLAHTHTEYINKEQTQECFLEILKNIGIEIDTVNKTVYINNMDFKVVNGTISEEITEDNKGEGENNG